MLIGFNLELNEYADIFGSRCEYMMLQERGERHLSEQQAKCSLDLETYIMDKAIDGTKIQNDWFPQINADVFISHSGKDKELAYALAGWLNKNFALKCFVDSAVWGYAPKLLDNMIDKYSEKTPWEKGGFLYDLKSCIKISEHVNTMLSIALQKMIDKVEAVILLNTENSIRVCMGDSMNQTYSPWIYTEIVCTEIVRQRSLWEYRDYSFVGDGAICESEEPESIVNYDISLKHLVLLTVEDLESWLSDYKNREKGYLGKPEYALDVLYESVYSDVLE